METVHGLWVETSKSRRYKSSRESRLNPYSWGLDPQILMVTSPCLMIRSLILLNVCGWNPKQNQHLVLNFLPKINILSNFSVSFLLPGFSAGLWSAELRPAAALWCCGVYLGAVEGTIQESTGHLADSLGRWCLMIDEWLMIDDCCRCLFWLNLWLGLCKLGTEFYGNLMRF